MFIGRNYQSTQVCDQCRAVQPHKKTPAHLMHLIYTNFSLDAPWTRTIRSHETYLNETPPSQRSPWVEVPGFNISRVCWDTAHTILLGTGKDIVGGFLCDLASWYLSIHLWIFSKVFSPNNFTSPYVPTKALSWNHLYKHTHVYKYVTIFILRPRLSYLSYTIFNKGACCRWLHFKVL